MSVACEDASGTLAGVVHDPVRDHVFAAVRGGAVRIDGAPAPGAHADALADLVLAGAIACESEEEARRAGKLHKRLVRRAGGRRALGSAALELAWTAAGRFGACFHEAAPRGGRGRRGAVPLPARRACACTGSRRSRTGSRRASSPPASRSRPSCWS